MTRDGGYGRLILLTIAIRQTAMGKFEALFQPGNIGRLQLKNRLVMNAMGTVLTDGQSNPIQRTLDYYAARARGGVGLVTTQCMAVSQDAATPWELAIYDDRFVPGIKSIINTIHDNGSKASVQLMHYGLLIIFGGFIPEGMTVKVPSLTSWLQDGRPYVEVTEDDIDRYVEDFAQSARRAKEAGADAVELHACHGCLVSTFMSPITNKRTDKYGGNAENRTRFAKRIVERIKEINGSDFPLIVKINVCDDMDGGVTIEEVLQQTAILEKAGADAISISSGLEYWTSMSIPCYAYPEGPMVLMAERVKESLKVPVITPGKISPELAERLLSNSKIDFIAMGRPLLADPDLPNKLKEGLIDDIRPCIYCNNCIRTDPGQGPCSVNPSLYREAKYPLPPADTHKKVVVVGGGIAGMQAAVLLSDRGHHVTLYEKSHELGGQWNIAAAQPDKDIYSKFVDYLNRCLEESGVAVKLGVEITLEKVLEIKPDVVILATGAVPRSLPVPGVRGHHVLQANDVIMGKVEPKGRIVVIGGRFIGMELALDLAQRGKKVSIITLANLGENGSKLERMTYRTLAKRLIELGVPVYTQTPALEITDSHVTISMGHDIFHVPADTVILAVGAQPDKKLAQELEGVVEQLHLIGDCNEPHDAAAATYQAARLASQI